jgi:pimeloyl-ACP methyl ester carboxylesterase
MTRRGLGRLLSGLVLLGVALVLGTSWWLGTQLVKPVQHRVPLPPDFPAAVLTIPGPGRNIAAWWADQGPGSPAVLLLHSIRADRSSMLGRARLLVRHHFSVLLIDLQAHGETPGSAITLGWRESADARAGLAWLRHQSTHRSIGVIGCSLGGAAVLLGPQPAGFDAVVLEAVYPRVQSAVENRIRIRLGPLAPVLTPLLLAQLKLRLDISPSDLEPIRRIGQLGSPVLIVAGSRDKHTTLAESEELFRSAAEPKELWVVGGAAHQDFLVYDPHGYEATVVGFFSRYLSASKTSCLPSQASARRTTAVSSGGRRIPRMPLPFFQPSPLTRRSSGLETH